MMDDLVYTYDPSPDPLPPPAGAQKVWLYVGPRKVGGRGVATEMCWIVDDEGQGFIVQTGQPIDTTVVDE